MRFLNFKKVLNSFKVAFYGLKLAAREQTIRIMGFFALLVVFLMIYLKLSRIEQLILIFTNAVVLSLELFNTQIEKILDILKPNYDPQIKIIKDISAAAVLLSCLGALIIGILIFFPYIKKLF